MASAKKDTRDRSVQWNKDEEDDKDKKAFMKFFMASWKSSQKDKKRRRIKANVVIMILASPSKNIQHLLNL
jgi:hypothetical protein